MFLTTQTLHQTKFNKDYFKPKKFTFPFSYVPHAWVEQAAKEVQDYLTTQNDFQYGFGWDEDSVGKMFGVLVVEDSRGELGYLAAFSGKINEYNHLPGFVPPVFDVLDPNGFFKKGETTLNALTKEIKELEQSPRLVNLQKAFQEAKDLYDSNLRDLKAKHKQAKLKRKQRRVELQALDKEAQKEKLLLLENESKRDHYNIKDFKRSNKTGLKEIETQLAILTEPIKQLKLERGNLSAKLQQQVHQSFKFLNAKEEQKELLDIFSPLGIAPPAGAGECAAPRLLQYAYKHQLKPICMGEFWWGRSPGGIIRKEKHFYPACKSKCKPILTFMLEGLTIEDNPITNKIKDFSLDVVYEDDLLLVVNKPAGVLSVPGKDISESLQTKLQEKFANKAITLVHRLDMATSGLVLVAKSNEVYKALQEQFTNRTVQKTYTAILDGNLKQLNGKIDLPLRVDLDNRPMQMVCYQHGKKAITYYKVLEKLEGNKTKVLFFPYTGRTHQLRVHAAHKNGLNMPILGDVLYGRSLDRLYLHATELVFYHPDLKKEIKVISPAPF